MNYPRRGRGRGSPRQECSNGPTVCSNGPAVVGQPSTPGRGLPFGQHKKSRGRGEIIQAYLNQKSNAGSVYATQNSKPSTIHKPDYSQALRSSNQTFTNTSPQSTNSPVQQIACDSTSTNFVQPDSSNLCDRQTSGQYSPVCSNSQFARNRTNVSESNREKSTECDSTNRQLGSIGNQSCDRTPGTCITANNNPAHIQASSSNTCDQTQNSNSPMQASHTVCDQIKSSSVKEPNKNTSNKQAIKVTTYENGVKTISYDSGDQGSAYHRHNMYCSTVCSVQVEKFVPESHMEMLVKWVAHILQVWGIWKQGDLFTKNVTDFFSTFPDPYSSSVYLLVEIPGEKSKNSKGLFAAVVSLFQSWIEPRRDVYTFHLHSELKHILLNKWTLISCADSLRKLRLAFQCDSEVAWVLGELLPTLKRTHKYREIRMLVEEFNLLGQVSILDFLVPFVFQNKLNYVEECLKCHPQFQVPLLKYLDELINSRNLDLRVKQIANEQDIPEVKYESLRYKPLSKLIVRLMKEYNIPQSACANALGNKQKATLAFVVEKYFVAKSLNTDSWREMALDIVKDNSTLQKELVDICVNYYDYREAYHWCQRFKLNPNIVGFDLRDRIAQEEDNQLPENDWDDVKPEDYYSLSLPHNHIIVVDTNEKMVSTLQAFAKLERNSYLGLDTEWKPNLSGGSPPTLALLQIATRDFVYILDIVTLSKLPNYIDLCLELELILFANDELLKIGFNLMPDVNIIKTCLPFSEAASFNERSYLDLSILWSKLVAETCLTFPYKDNSNTTASQSLSALVFKCFGKRLNKQDQFSNWENRPLRVSQIEYAALDALCLVQVYELLANRCAAQGIQLGALVTEVLRSNVGVKKAPPKAKSKKKKKKSCLPPAPLNKVPVTTEAVCFMCDVTLKSLARMLRRHGMDTMCAVSDTKECLGIVTNEVRYLLTRGNGYGQLVSQVPPGHCLKIESHNVPDQFEEVLRYYNIILPSCIQPRCEECNSADFSTLDQTSALKLLAMMKPAPSQRLDLEFEAHCRVDAPYESQNYRLDEAYDEFDDEYYEEDEDALPPPICKMYKAVDPGFGYTKNKVDIKIEDVPLQVIEQLPRLTFCEDCGVIVL